MKIVLGIDAICVLYYFNALLSHYVTISYSSKLDSVSRLSNGRNDASSSSINHSIYCQDWLIFVIIFLFLTQFFIIFFASLLGWYCKGEFWFISNPLLSLIGSTWYLNTLVALMGRGRVWGFFFVGFDTYMMLFFL